MHIFIAGGTGLIGQAFIEAQYQLNHQITVITRNKKRAHQIFKNNIKFLSWDEMDNPTGHQPDVIINLCGENIANHRWRSSIKKRLTDSRIQPSQRLIHYCKKIANDKKIHLINASGIGIYGLQNTTDKTLPVYDEYSPIDQKPLGFLQQLSKQWEEVSHSDDPKIHTTHCRTFVVDFDCKVFCCFWCVSKYFD